MNDPLIILGLAEVILFLSWFGILSCRKPVGAKRKKIGIILLVIWIVILAVGITWGIIRKVS